MCERTYTFPPRERRVWMGSLSKPQVELVAVGLVSILTAALVRGRVAVVLAVTGVAPAALAFGRWRGRPRVEWASSWLACARRSRHGGHVYASAGGRGQTSGEVMSGNV